MIFQKEILIQAPIQFVYQSITDPERSLNKGAQIVDLQYDHTNTGGKSVAMIEYTKKFGTTRVLCKSEILKANPPYSFQAKTITHETVFYTNVELKETGEGTLLNISYEFSYTDWGAKLLARLSQKRMFQTIEQRVDEWKEHIEMRYLENPNYPTGSKKYQVSTEEIEKVSLHKPKKIWMQYLYLVIGLFFLCLFLGLLSKGKVKVVPLTVGIFSLGYFFSRKTTYLLLVVVTFLLATIFQW